MNILIYLYCHCCTAGSVRFKFVCTSCGGSLTLWCQVDIINYSHFTRCRHFLYLIIICSLINFNLHILLILNFALWRLSAVYSLVYEWLWMNLELMNDITSLGLIRSIGLDFMYLFTYYLGCGARELIAMHVSYFKTGSILRNIYDVLGLVF